MIRNKVIRTIKYKWNGFNHYIVKVNPADAETKLGIKVIWLEPDGSVLVRTNRKGLLKLFGKDAE